MSLPRGVPDVPPPDVPLPFPSQSAFPSRMREARWIVSVQIPSDAATPEEAAQEVRDRLRGDGTFEMQVVSFDGFRWTYGA